MCLGSYSRSQDLDKHEEVNDLGTLIGDPKLRIKRAFNEEIARQSNTCALNARLTRSLRVKRAFNAQLTR